MRDEPSFLHLNDRLCYYKWQWNGHLERMTVTRQMWKYKIYRKEIDSKSSFNYLYSEVIIMVAYFCLVF